MEPNEEQSGGLEILESTEEQKLENERLEKQRDDVIRYSIRSFFSTREAKEILRDIASSKDDNQMNIGITDFFIKITDQIFIDHYPSAKKEDGEWKNSIGLSVTDEIKRLYPQKDIARLLDEEIKKLPEDILGGLDLRRVSELLKQEYFVEKNEEKIEPSEDVK